MVKIFDRTARTMEEVIRMWVNPGSQITTDGCRSYIQAVRTLDDSSHFIVNHEENFVDPYTLKNTILHPSLSDR